MSVLMAFLMGCEKDEFPLPQEGTNSASELRDVPAEPQLPAWKVAILEIDDYIMEMADENVLEPRFGEVLLGQPGIVEELLDKGIMGWPAVALLSVKNEGHLLPAYQL